MPKKLTTEEFVSKAKKIHGDKYDYSKSYYHNSKSLIKIICHNHGVFNQSPNSHLRKRGCPSCRSELMSKLMAMTQSEFVKISKKIHNNKYKYNNVKYKNFSTKIEIICPKHGSFTQLPSNHIKGHGCSKCRSDSMRVTKIKSTDFINNCRKVHGDEYDYSSTKYTGSKNKIKIVCKKHGMFNQLPFNHLCLKHKCPKCTKVISKPELEFLDYLGIPNKVENRQVYIKPYNIDGYDEKTNTIYEFLGDYWHGNPYKYKMNEINEVCKKTFKQLYNETITRFEHFRQLGYNIKYIWESDWKNFKNKNGKFLLSEFTEKENRGI